MINYQRAKKILKEAKIRIKFEEILIKNSLNRVVAKDIISPSNNPLDDNAAFDGYAVNANDTKYLHKKKTKHFKIIGTIAAGTKPLKKKVNKFETIEIMTGGIISKPFNTIIPIEKIIFYPNKRRPKSIVIDEKIKKNNHIRFKSSDYKVGDVVIKKGTIIQSKHILALKSLGIKTIRVVKKLNILFFQLAMKFQIQIKFPVGK